MNEQEYEQTILALETEISLLEEKVSDLEYEINDLKDERNDLLDVVNRLELQEDSVSDLKEALEGIRYTAIEALR